MANTSIANHVGQNGAAANGERLPSRLTSQLLVQVQKMQATGALTLPSDYNVGNAVTSAWLKLQTVANRDNKLIIKDGQLDSSVVTVTSTANALQDYVVQGLNCAKNQAYFIVYGNQLVCQRSYHGDMAVAERVRPGITFYYDSIRKDEAIEMSKTWTKHHGLVTVIKTHDTPFPRNEEVVGAYCGVVDENGEAISLTIFDIARIRKSWAMSKMYSATGNGTHNKFPEEMAIRTVVRHACKSIINSSNDEALSLAMRRQDEEAIEAEVAEDAAQNANRETITFQRDTEVPVREDIDQETGEVIGDEEIKDPGF